MIKILLVDDEREEREGIAYLIRKYGYPLEIIEASSGKEALKLLQRQQVNILFTDIKMPVMSGLELARAAKEIDPDIRIIIFSAYAEFEYAKQAIEMKAISYLIKPIEIDEFRALMDSVINAIHEARRKDREMEAAREKDRKNSLYRLFTSRRIDADDAGRLKEYLFPEKKGSFFILNIEFMKNYFEENADDFLQLAQMYIGKDMEYIELYPNEAYVIVKSVELLRGERLEVQLNKLSRDIFLSVRDEVLYLVSSPVGDMDELEKQLNMIHSIKTSVFGYDNRIIRVADYYNDSEHYASDVETARKQLLAAIDSRDVDLIRRQNREFIRVASSLKKVSKLYIQNALYSVTKAVYDRFPRLETENILIAAEAFFAAKDPKTMFGEYEQILEKILSSMGDREEDDSRIIQRIKNVVETEYMKDIGLNEVAERVNLAPAYVSYIFKKETGQTLVKYITDIKMQKAKKLLSNMDYKIVQIGRMLGYENQSYFNRLFKNYYGVTPRQYRENL